MSIMTPTVMKQMRELSDRSASETENKTGKWDRSESQRKMLTSLPCLLLSNRRDAQRTSPSPDHRLPPRHNSTVIPPLRLSATSSDMLSPFSRWMLVRVPNTSLDDYSKESWTSFHKKYSTKAHRTANMTFKEIERQQRRELEPSIFVRCVCCFHPRSDRCDCGDARCDCNDASPKKSFGSPDRIHLEA